MSTALFDTQIIRQRLIGQSRYGKAWLGGVKFMFLAFRRNKKPGTSALRRSVWAMSWSGRTACLLWQTAEQLLKSLSLSPIQIHHCVSCGFLP